MSHNGILVNKQRDLVFILYFLYLSGFYIQQNKIKHVAWHKLFLKDEYKDDDNAYENALLVLNLESLEKRRNLLYSSFANGCIKNHTYDDLFIENNSNPTKTRFSEKYS